MKIHYLQHVPFEGLGSLEGEFSRRGYGVTASHLYAGDELPGQDEFDWLVVMGGPMNIDDHHQFPWLAGEKAFIADAIARGKRVLGICLGAQLIASALGAEVRPGRHREIGWFEVSAAPGASQSPFAAIFSTAQPVFHWHGDTFALPEGAEHLASSEACENQAFALGHRVLALQFHLETTPASAEALIHHCADELDNSRYVQTSREMLANPERFAQINRLMTRVIDIMA